MVGALGLKGSAFGAAYELHTWSQVRMLILPLHRTCLAVYSGNGSAAPPQPFRTNPREAIQEGPLF